MDKCRVPILTNPSAAANFYITRLDLMNQKEFERAKNILYQFKRYEKIISLYLKFEKASREMVNEALKFRSIYVSLGHKRRNLRVKFGDWIDIKVDPSVCLYVFMSVLLRLYFAQECDNPI